MPDKKMISDFNRIINKNYWRLFKRGESKYL